MTDWNQRYASGDTPWEKGAPAPPLIEFLQKSDLDVWGNGEILIPGCGTGHDVRALAAAGLKPRGVDLAPLALENAEKQMKVGLESYELGNFLDADWHVDRSFSAIWEHTCFCAINPSQRSAYASACANLVSPGGHLIGVFFLTPNDSGEEGQGPPFNTSVTELDEHFSQWFDRIDSWIPGQAYPGREGKEWFAIYRRGDR